MFLPARLFFKKMKNLEKWKFWLVKLYTHICWTSHFHDQRSHFISYTSLYVILHKINLRKIWVKLINSLRRIKRQWCIQRDLEAGKPVWAVRLGPQKSLLVQYILISIHSDQLSVNTEGVHGFKKRKTAQ